MNVVVCIVSYKRPQGLTRLLRGLDALHFQKSMPPALEILVVDNDPEQSASAVCRALAPELRWPLRYEVEPRRGISSARNRAVRCAEGCADFVAFIDDDEVPEPHWLDELLDVQQRYEADVVAGPVVPQFEENTPAWIVEGKFFDLPRYRTGQLLEHAYTGNVLVRTQIFSEVEQSTGALFDEGLGLTGGEDIHFFLRVARAGYKLVWADEALVREWIPESRANAKWLLQRAYRVANGRSLSNRALEPSSHFSTKHVVHRLGLMAKGVLLLPLALLLGRGAMVKALWYIYFAAGSLTGMAGFKYEEYQVTHGS